MAIETFTFSPDDEAGNAGTFRVRRAQFGYGYAQVTGDGPNNEEQSWTLTFGGDNAERGEVLAFIRRHAGYRAFLWTNPRGELGLYRCETYNDSSRPGAVGSLSLTFDQAFAP